MKSWKSPPRGGPVAHGRGRPLCAHAAHFEEIRNQPKGVGGEIQLTDAIARLMAHEAVYAYQYSGKRYDCGSKGLS
jgi:UTP--glucose-1-phosphate uridylyltransferase